MQILHGRNDHKKVQKAAGSKEKREAVSLMLKVRYMMSANWEFERFLRYMRDYPQELMAAGESLLIDDLAK